MLQFVPLTIVKKILLYLEVEELYKIIPYLSRGFQQIVHEQGFMMNIIYQYIKIGQINGELKSIVVSLRNFKQYELPFWGMKSNSGVFQNSLRFWIGKAFLKTKRPQVVLNMMNQIMYLEGSLSKKPLKWKQSLLNFLNSCFPFALTKKQSKVEIIQVYQLLYSSIYTQQIEYNEDEMSDFHHLLSYQNKMSNIIQQQNDQFKIRDLQAKRMENVVGQIRSIRIKRQTDFREIIKTIFIFTTNNLQFPEQYRSEIKGNQITDLLQMLKENQEFVPYRSNIVEMKNIAKIIEENDVKFCTFQENQLCEFNPLIWIQFPENQYKLKFKLQSAEYRFAKSVHMKFLDKQIQQDKEINCGVSLAYVSFKGACFNQFSMNYIQLK